MPPRPEARILTPCAPPTESTRVSQTLQCPNCDSALRPFRVHKYAAVHACHPGCSGIWIGRLNLRRIDHLTKGDLRSIRDVLLSLPSPTGPATAHRKCPLGHGPLQLRRHNLVPTVEVDHCSVCDCVFLDAGELAAIRERPMTPREYLTYRRGLRDRARDRELDLLRRNFPRLTDLI